MTTTVIPQTENDKTAAAEEAFVAAFAKDAPLAEQPDDEPKHEPAKPVKEPPPAKPDEEQEEAKEPEETEEETVGSRGETVETDEEKLAADEAAKTEAAFQAALKKHGAKLTLDDVPEDARPLVKQRLKELEAPWTRALQEATAFRKTAAEFRAEERFRTEHPAEYVLKLLLDNPKLSDEVNAKLEEIGESPTNQRAHQVVIEDLRAKAAKAEDEATAKQLAHEAERQREITALQTHLDARLESRGLTSGPSLQRMLNDRAALNAKEKGEPQLTTAEIDEIVAIYAKDAVSTRREQARDASGQYVKAKVNDRKTAGLKIKPGSGAPAPAGSKPRPATEDAFIEDVMSRIPG